MVTIVEKTVKPAGGGHYTSLQTWLVGQGGDLPFPFLVDSRNYP